MPLQWSYRMFRILLLISGILVICSITSTGAQKYLPPSCKYCNDATAPRSLRMAETCGQCGQIYGFMYIHCCLCDLVVYEGCKAATKRFAPFGRRWDLRHCADLKESTKMINLWMIYFLKCSFTFGIGVLSSGLSTIVKRLFNLGKKCMYTEHVRIQFNDIFCKISIIAK